MTTQPKQPSRAKAREVIADPYANPGDAQPVREAARETRELKAGEFLGRDGEILKLKRDPDRQVFDVPAHLKDPGWSYDWKRDTVFGMPDVRHQVGLAENGWRAVLTEPGSKWSGHFMPNDYRGPITRDGLVLMERPMAMTQTVLAQEKQRAGALMKDNIDKYTRRRAAIDSSGAFTTDNPNVPASIKESFDMGPPQGKHQIAIE